MTPATASDYSHLVGYRFPDGSVTAHAHMARFWAEATGLEYDPDIIHPSFVLFLALDGVESTIEELLAPLDTRPQDGGIAGGTGLELLGEVRIGETYVVGGEITAVERKNGRRTGPFDRITFTATMREVGSGEAVAKTDTVWIVARPQERDALDR
jgi:hypothetical protein